MLFKGKFELYLQSDPISKSFDEALIWHDMASDQGTSRMYLEGLLYVP